MNSYSRRAHDADMAILTKSAMSHTRRRPRVCSQHLYVTNILDDGAFELEKYEASSHLGHHGCCPRCSGSPEDVPRGSSTGANARRDEYVPKLKRPLGVYERAVYCRCV